MVRLQHSETDVRLQVTSLVEIPEGTDLLEACKALSTSQQERFSAPVPTPADTEQYYLDLKKDIDYDAQIEKRAEALSDDALDRAYYSAIKALMECSDDLHYPGFQIWQYQIEWQERRVERMGYLFFGAPNDRPTAQPERDFYIYFLQPFDKLKFSDNNLADEVFFRLKSPDEDYKRYLSQYAAALDLASTVSGGAKIIYQSKTQDSLWSMSKWLQEKQTH